LGILNDYEGINRAWENIEENIKTTAKESLGLHELKKKEYLKAKIEEFEHNSKIKIPEACMRTSLILRGDTGLELT